MLRMILDAHAQTSHAQQQQQREGGGGSGGGGPQSGVAPHVLQSLPVLPFPHRPAAAVPSPRSSASFSGAAKPQGGLGEDPGGPPPLLGRRDARGTAAGAATAQADGDSPAASAATGAAAPLVLEDVFPPPEEEPVAVAVAAVGSPTSVAEAPEGRGPWAGQQQQPQPQPQQQQQQQQQPAAVSTALEVNDCCICLEAFAAGDPVLYVPCRVRAPGNCCTLAASLYLFPCSPPLGL